MIKLDGRQREQLRDALTKAFPSQNSLKQMVSYELEETLDEICPPGNINDVAFELIGWARSKGRLDDLVESAYRQNSTNPELLQFYQRVWLPLANDARNTTSEDQSQTSISTDTPATLSVVDDCLDVSPSLSDPQESEIASDQTPLLQPEQLRAVLLDHTKLVSEAIQRYQQVFLQNKDIYRDQCRFAYSHMKSRCEALSAILNELLKKQRVNIELHYQFNAEKDEFIRKLETIGLLLGDANGHASLLNIRSQSLNDIKALEQKLKLIDRLIDMYCNQLGQSVSIAQLFFPPKSERWSIYEL